eukprot:SAG22_NODE_873_length_6721_cov_19.182395_6_plen_336_part_00
MKVDAEAAAFALWRPGGYAAVLRTHPPEPGLPGIAAMEYAGAFPVSRLDLIDPQLSAAGGVQAARLYGVSGFKLHDANASNVPAVWFALDVQPQQRSRPKPRPAAESENGDSEEGKVGKDDDSRGVEARDGNSVSGMFSLPASLLGPGAAVQLITATSGASDGSLTRVCIKQAGGRDRHGELCISAFAVAAATGKQVPVSLSAMAASNLSQSFAVFKKAGALPSNTGGLVPNASHAVLAAKIPAESGGGRVTLVFTMAWSLPARSWAGGEPIGQAYSQRFSSAAAVSAAANTPVAVSSALGSALYFQALFFNNSFPEWLQDGLIQSAATFGKTGL